MVMLAKIEFQQLGASALSAIIFGLIGVLLMVVGFKAFDWITPRINIEKELVREAQHRRGDRNGGGHLRHQLYRGEDCVGVMLIPLCTLNSRPAANYDRGVSSPRLPNEFGFERIAP